MKNRFVTLIAFLLPLVAPAQVQERVDTLQLDETVVVGFATQKKVNLTGAVSAVQMEEVLSDRPILSVGAALQGAIPGLSISGGSTPGQAKNFNIRGTLSINGGSPLVLIDNVEGDLSALSPEDIESISVLKDAASAAIYGARAAGGVVLVTTKRPKSGEKFHLDYSFNLGFERSLASPEQCSLQDYISTYTEAGFSNQYWAGGGQLSRWQELLGLYLDGSLEGVYSNGIYKDSDGAVYFLKEGDPQGAALEAGFLSSHKISASGGSERIRYRVSGTYDYENGPMVSNKDSYSRKALNGFISADITDYLTQEASFFYTDKRQSSIMSVFRDPYSVKLISWYPEGYMPKEIVGGTEDLLIDSPRNACLYQPASLAATSTPRIALKTILKPLKGWTITAEYSYQQKDYSFNSFTGQHTVADAQLQIRKLPADGQDKYILNTSVGRYNALNIYSNYSLKLGGHNMGAMLGFNQESQSARAINNSVLGQSVITVPSLQGGTGTRISSESTSEYSIRGYFARLSYNYLGRYLLEANARYDGSSKFPKSNRYGLFPSVSAAWRLSDEPFLRWIHPAVNNLKLRASWGSIGNQNISPYGFIASMGINQSNVWLDKGELVNVISTPGLIRANYTWEAVSTLDFGLDLNAFRNRLSLVFDAYRRTTKGMLSSGVELPAVVGSPAPLQNVADMATRGWELSIDWKDHFGELTYYIGFNVYDHLSTITKFNNASGNLSYNYVGKTLGEIWGYTADGYYSIDDFDLDKARKGVWVLNEGVPSLNGYTAKPGDVKFKDYDGNGTISAGSSTLDEPGDRRIIGNSTPRYEFGARMGFSWKGLDFSLMLQGVGKRDYFLNVGAIFPFASSSSSEFPFAAVYSNQTDYWRAKSYDPESEDFMVAVNPDAALPRIYSQLQNSGSNMRVSDRYLQSAAYLRIKNVSLSYTFPSKILRRTRVIEGFRIYASCENLYTFTSLPRGYDPESLSWTYPFYRTLSFGAHITF
ncbi:MAG: SusC/RagA family TonB-linked outer membrane protein [Bacteroidales bacterium]|nr:SusC/RagA family TonB-linked outer membrane protein [Bacteroidales bacterium]